MIHLDNIKMQSRVQSSVRIRAPLEQVSSLIEDVSRVPEWNPLVTGIRRREGGRNSNWDATIEGRRLQGNSEAQSWQAGREYSWRSTETTTGGTAETKILLDREGNDTVVTGILSYNVRNEAVPNFSDVAIKRLAENSLERALRNIKRIVARD